MPLTRRLVFLSVKPGTGQVATLFPRGCLRVATSLKKIRGGGDRDMMQKAKQQDWSEPKPERKQKLISNKNFKEAHQWLFHHQSHSTFTTAVAQKQNAWP